MSLNLPPEAVMRDMAKLAMEQAMQSVAGMADRFAADPRMLKLNGKEALTAFAAAMRSTNAKVWPTSERGADA
jgi:hypothetical protein